MIELLRLEQTHKGTIGVLRVNGVFVCCTLELPWKDNTPNVSCFPTGMYEVHLEYSHRYNRKLWEVKGVEGRSEIKFHIANFLTDLRGCVGVGLYQSHDSDGQRSVLKSAKAFDRFMAAMGDRMADQLIVKGV